MNKGQKTDWAKMAKYLDQEMNASEKEDFEKDLRSDEESSGILESAREIWNATKNIQNMIEVNTDSAWEKLKKRIENQEKITDHAEAVSYRKERKILFNALRIAAVLLVVAGLSLIVYRSFIYPDISSGKQMVVRTEPDRMTRTILSDGSVLDIKANSRIRYRTGRGGTRELALKGEAFFEIAPDPGRPFIISAGPAIIKVTGTAFSVMTEKNKHAVSVYVESGLVSLSAKGMNGQSVTLEPGYIGTLTKKGIEKKLNNDENRLAWKTGKLVFRMTPLSSVINDLNHTYNTSITIESPVISDCNFTGTFLDHQPVDTVLEVLKTAFNLNVKRTSSDIILNGNGCN
jgi:ferric-dicitrate binding protein FerR (iron transport regulator)